jgi:hypothetical protein
MSSRAIRGILPCSGTQTFSQSLLQALLVCQGRVQRTRRICPNEASVGLFFRDKHAVPEHVNVRAGRNQRALHSLLALGQDKICNSAFGIVVAPMVSFIPVGIFECIIRGSIDIMLHAFVSCDFVGSNTVEELIFLTQGETICIDPRSVNPVEGSMQIFLIVLRSFYQGDIRKVCQLFCSGRVGIPSQHSYSVAFAR